MCIRIPSISRNDRYPAAAGGLAATAEKAEKGTYIP
jgi:hypothetical protein